MSKDELKDIWEKAFSDTSNIDKSEIEKIMKMKRKTETVVSKLNKTYLLNVFAGIFLIVSLAFMYSGFENVVMRSLAIVGLLILIPYMVYLTKKYRKINKEILGDYDIKAAMENILDAMNRMFKYDYYFTFILVALIIPVFYTTGFSIGYTAAKSGFKNIELTMPEFNKPEIIAFAIIYILAFVATHFLWKFMAKILYHKHLDKLKENLVELEKQDGTDY